MYDAHIHIAHRPGSGVIAEGDIDPVAAELLRRAGFGRVQVFSTTWWHAPYDLDEEETVAAASAAFVMLKTARYQVSIEPELLSLHDQFSDTTAAVTAQIADADNLDTITGLISPVADPGHGTLAGVTHQLRAVEQWMRTASACTYRDDLARKVSEAVTAVERARSAVGIAVDSLEWVPTPMRGRTDSPLPPQSSAGPRAAAALTRSSPLAGSPAPDAPTADAPSPPAVRPAPRR